MKGFGKPHFISQRESAPFGSLAALRDRGLVRCLTRSNTLVVRKIVQLGTDPFCTFLVEEAEVLGFEVGG